MDIAANIVMLAWPLVVIGLFCALPSRRAVITSFLTAWLFLPTTNYALPMLPDYTKMTATSLSVLLGLLLFDSGRLATLRLGLVDLPMAIFCATPFISSMMNDLGLWDGTSAIVARLLIWGLPYLIGRLYITDRSGLQDLAIGVFISGLVYMPLCWFEMRMSPQLHSMFYGTHQHHFAQSVRFGGWRPTVFMQHGLMVAAWMASASLVGLILWRTRTLTRLLNLPISAWVGMQVATTILCRSTGALVLLAMGISCYWLVNTYRVRLALSALLIVAPAYIGVRVMGIWDGNQVVGLARQISEERAQSLQFRLDNEDMLIEKALQRPVFGWGGWGRSRVDDERGNDVSVTDGLWLIELGTCGLAGLVACFALMLSPLALLLWRHSSRQLSSSLVGPAVALTLCTTLYAIDCLLNGMVNPVFILMTGGLATCTTNKALNTSNATGQTSTVNLNARTQGNIVIRSLHTGGVG